jgi:hypothetical protein
MMVTPEKQYAHNPTGLSEMLNCSFDRPAYEFDGATFYFNLAGKYAQGYSYVIRQTLSKNFTSFKKCVTIERCGMRLVGNPCVADNNINGI